MHPAATDTLSPGARGPRALIGPRHFPVPQLLPVTITKFLPPHHGGTCPLALPALLGAGTQLQWVFGCPFPAASPRHPALLPGTAEQDSFPTLQAGTPKPCAPKGPLRHSPTVGTGAVGRPTPPCPWPRLTISCLQPLSKCMVKKAFLPFWKGLGWALVFFQFPPLLVALFSNHETPRRGVPQPPQGLLLGPCLVWEGPFYYYFV